MSIYIGFGFDVHRLVVGRKLILGGVDIPFEKGLIGYSDADVLLHAIADSILGAGSLGDIGTHFPDTDSKFKDISSLTLLNLTKDILYKAGFEIVNIDSTILLEKPKIAPYIWTMKQNISIATGIDIERISIKATTMEGLGFIGYGDGCSAYAITMIKKIEN